MVRVININATDCLSNDECDKFKGLYLGSDSYETIIDEDCDYLCEGVPIFKFRKKPFHQETLNVAWDNCKYMAVASRGRGAAAGPIDPESVYWKKRDISKIDKWSAKYMVKDKKTGEMKESKMRVNNTTASSPIGFYGRTKGLGVDLPCRLSHYTKTNMDKFKGSIPFFQSIAEKYNQLMPDKYESQRERAIQNDYHIHETPFSTITINRNFRTAVHKDTGDFGGWACLSVLEENKYHGGLFVMPKYKIAIDMRHGDLLVANVHEYHGNTELYETEEDKKYNDENPQQTYKDNLEVGVLGLNNRFSRLSFVCYLREDIIKCEGYNKFVISLKDSERLPQWANTEYKHFEGVNGKETLSYDCESCNKMVSYHNIRNTPQHLGKTGCFLSHMKLLKHIVDHKLNKCIIVEDDALQVNQLPESLPDTFCYLGGFIMNKKITNTEKFIIQHKQGLNTLDEKYRMVCCLAYYIPRWEIAQEIFQQLLKLKRWRAIDISIPNLLKETNYIYPAVYIEEPSKSQIENKTKNKFANEFYSRSNCKMN
tara:strand:- start:1444 stop:3060 length:1617 start_codon:yes stop_codon:yes gene_type:complete